MSGKKNTKGQAILDLLQTIKSTRVFSSTPQVSDIILLVDTREALNHLFMKCIIDGSVSDPVGQQFEFILDFINKTFRILTDSKGAGQSITLLKDFTVRQMTFARNVFGESSEAYLFIRESFGGKCRSGD